MSTACPWGSVSCSRQQITVPGGKIRVYYYPTAVLNPVDPCCTSVLLWQVIMAEKTAQSEAPPSPCKTKSTAVYHTHCKPATRASLHFLPLDWCYFAIFSHYWSRFAQQEAFSLHMGILYFLLDRRLHFLGSCTWQSLTCGSPRL